MDVGLYIYIYICIYKCVCVQCCAGKKKKKKRLVAMLFGFYRIDKPSTAEFKPLTCHGTQS